MSKINYLNIVHQRLVNSNEIKPQLLPIYGSGVFCLKKQETLIVTRKSTPNESK